jgi:hypothetical protein
METKTIQPSIIKQVQQYVETRVKLLKYEGIDRASSIIAEVITDVIMAVLLSVTFIFFSLTLALFAAHLLSSYWEGFGCVTLLYVIIVATARALKISIQNKLIGIFIKKVFKKQTV